MTEISDTKSSLPVGVQVRHKHYGLGRIVQLDPPFYVVRFNSETARVPFEYREMHMAQGSDPQLEQIKFALEEVLLDFGLVRPEEQLGKRWVGGELVLVPGKKETKEKRIPLEAFFKKVVGVRDKLRVLEQRINTNANIAPEEKLELQGYITRCYGSLTTFNVLFADQAEQFKGTGSEDG